MRDMRKKLKVGVVQLEPALFDAAGSLERLLRFADEAALGGAELVVFPELAIPGYPYGLSFGFTVGRRDESRRPDWARYAASSITVPGPETEALCKKAAERHIWLSAGISERDAVTGTLYNSNLIITPEGRLHSCHRKLKPTGAERVVWGDADRAYFPVAETPWGNMGALICWESYMPLARAALYQKGVTLYISPNTNDNPEWQDTARHIALEGSCYFINCDMIITRAGYPADLRSRDEVERLPELVCRGGSCVIGPDGHYVAGPLWDREGIVYAELDMDAVAASRMEFDPCGHYSRPDVLRLVIDDR